MTEDRRAGARSAGVYDQTPSASTSVAGWLVRSQPDGTPGNREYDAADISRVKVIESAQRLGSRSSSSRSSSTSPLTRWHRRTPITSGCQGRRDRRADSPGWRPCGPTSPRPRCRVRLLTDCSCGLSGSAALRGARRCPRLARTSMAPVDRGMRRLLPAPRRGGRTRCRPPIGAVAVGAGAAGSVRALTRRKRDAPTAERAEE